MPQRLALRTAFVAFAAAGLFAAGLAEWQAVAWWFDRGDWQAAALGVILALVAGAALWSACLELRAKYLRSSVVWAVVALIMLAADTALQGWQTARAPAFMVVGARDWLAWENRGIHAVWFIHWALILFVAVSIAMCVVIWKIPSDNIEMVTSRTPDPLAVAADLDALRHQSI